MVLLIDEVDRVEVETEALLLEILSDYQVSIPELGTITATQIPLVFLTSNNTRELSEALKRRCLYLHVDYPTLEREKEIVLAKVPDITEHLADQVARIVRSIRQLDLKKAPSVSETLDWARTLMLLNIDNIDEQTAKETLHILLKYQTDIAKAAKELSVDSSDTALSATVAHASCSICSTASSSNSATPGCLSVSPRTSTRWRRCSTSRSRIVRRSSTHSAPRWSRTTRTGGASRPCSRSTSAFAGPSTSWSEGDDDTDIDEMWREMQEQQSRTSSGGAGRTRQPHARRDRADAHVRR